MTDLNKAIEHIRTVCEDNAKSPNPEMVLNFIAHIISNAFPGASSLTSHQGNTP